MTEGKIIYTGIYPGLVILGLVSIAKISSDKFWDIPLYLEAVDDAEFISRSQKPLLISDFSFWYGSLNAFLALPNAIEKQDVDILRASPDIDNVRKKISPGKYSELYVIHASDKLVENLRSQFPGKIDSVKAENISPMWQIIN